MLLEKVPNYIHKPEKNVDKEELFIESIKDSIHIHKPERNVDKEQPIIESNIEGTWLPHSQRC